jgi:hypothetical protein
VAALACVGKSRQRTYVDSFWLQEIEKLIVDVACESKLDHLHKLERRIDVVRNDLCLSGRQDWRGRGRFLKRGGKVDRHELEEALDK